MSKTFQRKLAGPIRLNFQSQKLTQKDKKDITLHLIDGFLEFQAVCILSSYCMSTTPVSLNCFTSFKYSGIFRNFSIPSNWRINNLQINKCLLAYFQMLFLFQIAKIETESLNKLMQFFVMLISKFCFCFE